MKYFQQISQDSRPPAWANDRGFAESHSDPGNPEPIHATNVGESLSLLPLPAETASTQPQHDSGPSKIYPASDGEPMLDGNVRHLVGPIVESATSQGLAIGSSTTRVPAGTPVQSRSSARGSAGTAHRVSPSSPVPAVNPSVNKGSEKQPSASELHVDPIDSVNPKKGQVGRAPEALSRERELAEPEHRSEGGNVPGPGQFRGFAVKAAEDPVAIEWAELAPVDQRKNAHMRSEPQLLGHVAGVSEKEREGSACAPEYDSRFIGYAAEPDRSSEPTAPGVPAVPHVRIGQVDVIIQSPTPPKRATAEGSGSDGKASPWYLRTL